MGGGGGQGGGGEGGVAGSGVLPAGTGSMFSGAGGAAIWPRGMLFVVCSVRFLV